VISWWVRHRRYLMGLIRKLGLEDTPEDRRDLLGVLTAEGQQRAVHSWAAGGSITGYKVKQRWRTQWEAFLSGLGIGAMIGALGMLLLLLYLLEDNGINVLGLL
jgi:hypothetical protein